MTETTSLPSEPDAAERAALIDNPDLFLERLNYADTILDNYPAHAAAVRLAHALIAMADAPTLNDFVLIQTGTRKFNIRRPDGHMAFAHGFDTMPTASSVLRELRRARLDRRSEIFAALLQVVSQREDAMAAKEKMATELADTKAVAQTLADEATSLKWRCDNHEAAYNRVNSDLKTQLAINANQATMICELHDDAVQYRAEITGQADVLNRQTAVMCSLRAELANRNAEIQKLLTNIAVKDHRLVANMEQLEELKYTIETLRSSDARSGAPLVGALALAPEMISPPGYVINKGMGGWTFNVLGEALTDRMRWATRNEAIVDAWNHASGENTPAKPAIDAGPVITKEVVGDATFNPIENWAAKCLRVFLGDWPATAPVKVGSDIDGNKLTLRFEMYRGQVKTKTRAGLDPMSPDGVKSRVEEDGRLASHLADVTTEKTVDTSGHAQTEWARWDATPVVRAKDGVFDEMTMGDKGDKVETMDHLKRLQTGMAGWTVFRTLGRCAGLMGDASELRFTIQDPRGETVGHALTETDAWEKAHALAEARRSTDMWVIQTSAWASTRLVAVRYTTYGDITRVFVGDQIEAHSLSELRIKVLQWFRERKIPAACVPRCDDDMCSVIETWL